MENPLSCFSCISLSSMCPSTLFLWTLAPFNCVPYQHIDYRLLSTLSIYLVPFQPIEYNPFITFFIIFSYLRCISISLIYIFSLFSFVNSNTFVLGLQNNPEPFHMLAKELMPGRFKPTPTHYLIQLLHQKGLLLRCYTQNIDSLETCAGLPKVCVVRFLQGWYDV